MSGLFPKPHQYPSRLIDSFGIEPEFSVRTLPGRDVFRTLDHDRRLESFEDLRTLIVGVARVGRENSLRGRDAGSHRIYAVVAAGDSGKSFVDKLAAATGAVVYASDNPVGSGAAEIE